MVKWPKPVGEPRVLIKPRFNKTMFSQQFQHPATGEEYEFVFFGYTRPESAVIVFPITKDNRVVAIRQYRHGSHSVIIELPGGLKRTEEMVEDMAQKELLEETGYRPESMIHMKRHPVIIAPCNFAICFDAVLARGCEKIQEPSLEETEYAETILIPLAKWRRMVLKGEITDLKSIAVTHFALPYLTSRLRS